MGYRVEYTFHSVCIPASQSAAALTAIHQLYEPETIKRLGTGLMCDPPTAAAWNDCTTNELRRCYRGGHFPPPDGFLTLLDALWEWSLKTVQRPDGGLEIVGYRCDKAGDEAVLFDAIAPFLDYSRHPRIDVFQENNEHWRHTFSNGQHRQVPGKVVYADEYPELFDSSEM